MAQLSFLPLKTIRRLTNVISPESNRAASPKTVPIDHLIEEIYQSMESTAHQAANNNGEIIPVSKSLLERLKYYSDLLESKNKHVKKRDKPLANFYIGYYYQQVAEFSEDKEKKLFLERALTNYMLFLELSDRQSEALYYSQWQMGEIQYNLLYSWPKVQETLLKAHNLDPIRGEPLKAIIVHYITERQWDLAYIFSLYSKIYFNRNPYPTRKWAVDHSFYNWKILDLHMNICIQLGKTKEAAKCLKELLQQVKEHPDYFHPYDIDKIERNTSLFPVIP